MSDTDSQAYGNLKPGDKVEIIITTTLAEVDHWEPSAHSANHQNFTALTYRSGPDLPNGRPSLFTVEMPESPDDGTSISISKID